MMWRYLEMLLVSEPPEAPIMRIVALGIFLATISLALYWWYDSRKKFKKRMLKSLK